MTFVTVHCPHCDSEQIVKRGKTRRGTQRYLCQNTACVTGSFLLDYRNRGCLPEVKQQMVVFQTWIGMEIAPCIPKL
jgi:transposase-like protein